MDPSLTVNGFHLQFCLIETGEGCFQRSVTGLAFCNVGDGLVLVLLTGKEHLSALIKLLFY